MTEAVIRGLNLNSRNHLDQGQLEQERQHLRNETTEEARRRNYPAADIDEMWAQLDREVAETGWPGIGQGEVQRVAGVLHEPEGLVHITPFQTRRRVDSADVLRTQPVPAAQRR